jgi:hypothetical protein
MGRLIWLASYPKSGSTWLRTFLNNYLRDQPGPHDINSELDLSTGESGARLYRRYDPRPASQYSIADVQRMRPLVHRDLAAMASGTLFVKTHNAAVLVEGVPTVTPEVTAGAIYIVRDPRDVAISFSRHLARSLDATIALMADVEAATGGTDTKVYERLSSWSAHVHFWIRQPNPRLHVMQYEQMLAAPEQAFAEVIRFLGHTPDPARLARAIGFSAFAELRAQEQRAGFSERPPESDAPFFRAGQAGQWRTGLTAAQRTRVEQDHGAVMRRFGYL